MMDTILHILSKDTGESRPRWSRRSDGPFDQTRVASSAAPTEPMASVQQGPAPPDRRRGVRAARAEGEEAMRRIYSLLLGGSIGLFLALTVLTVQYVAGVLAG